MIRTAATTLAIAGAAVLVEMAVGYWWLMYGPETLLHVESPVYDPDGTYHGLR